jgi:hypothetical protein
MRRDRRLSSLLGAYALGAASMFVLDPARGRRRRALARDRLVRGSHEAQLALASGSRDLAHRSRGWLAELRGRLRAERVDDDVLTERVRARLGRLVGHPGAIEVGAHDGVVVLRGPILADEMASLLVHVRGVRGVRAVENRLDAHLQPDVSSLQGGGRHVARGPAWSPAARLLASVGAGTLLVRGVHSRLARRLALASLGVALFAG